MGGSVSPPSFIPGTSQTLNIFEPRYQALYNDILLSGSRTVAVFTKSSGNETMLSEAPGLWSIVFACDPCVDQKKCAHTRPTSPTTALRSASAAWWTTRRQLPSRTKTARGASSADASGRRCATECDAEW